MGRAHLMNPHRLCAAADSLLEAMGRLGPTSPGASEGGGTEGRTRVFTQTEINEAALMLARLGYLHSDDGPRG